MQIRSDLETLRAVMGRPTSSQPAAELEGISLHDLFFMSQSLFRRANRLAIELIDAPRELSSIAPDLELEWDDVQAVLEDTSNQIGTIVEAFGEGRADVPAPGESPGIGATFTAILEANRQIDHLLERRIRMTDVHGQVNRAIVFTAEILKRRGLEPVFPDPPEFEARKMPTDVYASLGECMGIISGISGQVGGPVLTLRSGELDPALIRSEDVYDLATLVVSHAASLSLDLGFEDPGEMPKPKYHPWMFPSHVFQRVGVLHAQLVSLEESVRSELEELGETAPETAEGR
ncbi:MAG: hypothetical protein J4G09_08680 [Proteobacteria bacterium]|nr:hypothetical protein [Pseudomonadota bacterium]